MENLLLMMMFCASKGLYIKKKKNPSYPTTPPSKKILKFLPSKMVFFFWYTNQSSNPFSEVYIAIWSMDFTPITLCESQKKGTFSSSPLHL